MISACKELITSGITASYLKQEKPSFSWFPWFMWPMFIVHFGSSIFISAKLKDMGCSMPCNLFQAWWNPISNIINIPKAHDCSSAPVRFPKSPFHVWKKYSTHKMVPQYTKCKQVGFLYLHKWGCRVYSSAWQDNWSFGLYLREYVLPSENPLWSNVKKKKELIP